MDPRTTRRRRRAAAAGLACLFLAACAGTGTPGDPAGSSAPPTTTAAPSAPATTTPSASGPWGAYAGRTEACAAVAEDLLALALLPASLSGGPAPAQVHAVEDEIAGMLAAAPPALAADLARVQLLVDSYGEELAEDPGARLDGAALDAALAPARDWLDASCRDAH